MEGTLLKKSSNIISSSWVSRFFKISGTLLKYYNNDSDRVTRMTIYLYKIQKVILGDKYGMKTLLGENLLFTIFTGIENGNKVFELQANSADECKAWWECFKVYNRENIGDAQFDINNSNIDIPTPIINGIKFCLDLLENNAASSASVFKTYISENAVKKLFHKIVVKNVDSTEDKDSNTIAEVLKRLLTVLPENIFSNNQLLPIIDECSRLTRSPIFNPEKELSTLIELIAKIKSPYFNLAQRLFGIFLAITNKSKYNTMTPKELALSSNNLFINTFQIEPTIHDMTPTFVIILSFYAIIFNKAKELRMRKMSSGSGKNQFEARGSPAPSRRSSNSIGSSKIGNSNGAPTFTSSNTPNFQSIKSIAPPLLLDSNPATKPKVNRVNSIVGSVSNLGPSSKFEYSHSRQPSSSNNFEYSQTIQPFNNSPRSIMHSIGSANNLLKIDNSEISTNTSPLKNGIASVAKAPIHDALNVGELGEDISSNSVERQFKTPKGVLIPPLKIGSIISPIHPKRPESFAKPSKDPEPDYTSPLNTDATEKRLRNNLKEIENATKKRASEAIIALKNSQKPVRNSNGVCIVM